MVDREHPRLSIARHCDLVSIARSSNYCAVAGESALNLHLMRMIDEGFLARPQYGSRKMARYLRRLGYGVGAQASPSIYAQDWAGGDLSGPKTSKLHPEHRIYLFLLRNVSIARANQVWCADITYIPMRRGFPYLVATMDWTTRAVLSWRLSNTMDAGFWVEALGEAMVKHGKPNVVNTDQGSQITSLDFTEALKEAGVKISMDGRGRWLDNVFIERLWRSLKYECIYLREMEDGLEAKRHIGVWMDHYINMNDRNPIWTTTERRWRGTNSNWRHDRQAGPVHLKLAAGLSEHSGPTLLPPRVLPGVSLGQVNCHALDRPLDPSTGLQ
jgi:putative transposase